MIVVIDYGMGNIRSVVKAFASLKFPVKIGTTPQDVDQASHVVLPGVGAFGDAMRELKTRNLIRPIKQAIHTNKPFLGICVGMQVLFDGSEENPGVPGLSVLRGRVKRFQTEEKVPHMGWNRLLFNRRPPIAEGLEESPFVYFVHSYFAVPEEEEVCAARTDYDGEFISMIWRNQLYATQFHPEKSQAVGLKLLAQFGKLRS